MQSIDEYLNSKDPLTREVVLFLIKYDEEDNRVDYKQTLDINSDKEWFGLTKDISAFANTLGGYLVFGVEDKKKETTGLTREVADVLKDSNNLQTKINSLIEPDLSTIRSKEFKINGKIVVAIYIPQSFNKTHIIKKDGLIHKQSNKPKTILNKGTFYVRRSAGNHLGDSRDLDDLVERRIDQFREALIDKVAQVVKTPADSKVLIYSKDPDNQDNDVQKFIIKDSPDATEMKGMSFTVSPDTPEQEIAAWTVLSSGNPNVKPEAHTIWKWYLNRENLEISESHRLSVFQFSLWVCAPAFYWIKGIENSKIRGTLLNAIRNRPVGVEVKQHLAVASFLGKSTYKAALKELGDYKNRIHPRQKEFPKKGPKIEYANIKKTAKQTNANLSKELLEEINKLSEKIVKSKKDTGVMNKNRAQEIDCFLYSQEDNYK